MKILYHHRTQAEDGQAVHIRALQQAWIEEGHEVVEVSLVKRSGEPAATSGARHASRKTPGSGWGLVARLPRFARELAEYGYTAAARPRLVAAGRRVRPDFLYERYAFGNAAGVQAARRLGLPLVLEVNSPMVLELARTRGLSFPRTARKLENYVFRSATRVCAVSGVLRDMLVELGVEPARILVTPNAVHLEQYEHADPAALRARARSELGLERAELVLGFVGYFRDWHRLELAVDALASLARAELVLVGEGPARADLEERARLRGVASRVHFAGKREHREIPALLTAFDVALVPAINAYASPLKLHEYMAASLAVVAPDQPNLREILVQGENALLVPPGDGEALLAALSRLALDAGLRAHAWARARGARSWSAI